MMLSYLSRFSSTWGRWYHLTCPGLSSTWGRWYHFTCPGLSSPMMYVESSYLSRVGHPLSVSSVLSMVRQSKLHVLRYMRTTVYVKYMRTIMSSYLSRVVKYMRTIMSSYLSRVVKYNDVRHGTMMLSYLSRVVNYMRTMMVSILPVQSCGSNSSYYLSSVGHPLSVSSVLNIVRQSKLHVLRYMRTTMYVSKCRQRRRVRTSWLNGSGR